MEDTEVSLPGSLQFSRGANMYNLAKKNKVFKERKKIFLMK